MVKISRLRKLNKTSRLRKQVIAEWTQINISNQNDVIQKLTDAMTYNYPVQINYEGSGWRTIQPYGFNTSKQKTNKDGNTEGGNILVMCYKDTGEVRSYRLDKIVDLYIDYDNQVSMTNNPQMNNDDETQIYEDIMNDQNENIDMPTLPEENNQTQQPGIYDNELSMLSNDNINVPIENIPDQDINNMDNSQQVETINDNQNVDTTENEENNIIENTENNNENIENEEEENNNNEQRNI